RVRCRRAGDGRSGGTPKPAVRLLPKATMRARSEETGLFGRPGGAVTLVLGAGPTPSRGGLDDGGGEAGALPRSYPQRRMKERQRQENSFMRIHERCIVIQYNIPFTW